MRKSKFVILVRYQSLISAVSTIVRFPKDQNTAVTGDPLYIYIDNQIEYECFFRKWFYLIVQQMEACLIYFLFTLLQNQFRGLPKVYKGVSNLFLAHLTSKPGKGIPKSMYIRNVDNGFLTYSKSKRSKMKNFGIFVCLILSLATTSLGTYH